MKVILLKDIKGTGKAGDVINVSDGHGKNYLIPRGLAKEATEGNLKGLAQQRKSVEKKKQEELDAAKEMAKKIEDMKVVIQSKAGESGKLFGAITTSEIAEKMKQENGVELDRKKMVLKNPIKSTGEYDVEVKLHPEVKAHIKVIVQGI